MTISVHGMGLGCSMLVPATKTETVPAQGTVSATMASSQFTPTMFPSPNGHEDVSQRETALSEREKELEEIQIKLEDWEEGLTLLQEDEEERKEEERKLKEQLKSATEDWE